LREHDAPDLFNEVAAMSLALHAPAVHRILLTDEFNAGVMQYPRLGILGWHRNYLVIGLPLLLALTPEQFRAVLAHEIGHLSGAHSRFGAWIYRMRNSWEQLLIRLAASQHWGIWAFLPFFRWYSPFFNAYSFVLARSQEYEADRAGVKVAGGRQMADALLTITLRGRFLHESFWPDIFGRANQQAHLPLPYRELEEALHHPLVGPNSDRWLTEALQQKNDPDDTHPILATRLAAIGQEAYIPSTLNVSAASWAFGEKRTQFIERMDHEWHDAVREQWANRYAEARAAAIGLQTLEQEERHRPLTAAETLQRAHWTAEFGDKDTALEHYGAALIQNPEAPEIHFAVGCLLLDKEDSAGIAQIARAINENERYTPEGCSRIISYLEQHGRGAEATTYQERRTAYYESLRAARSERAGINRGDTFVPHDLTQEAVTTITDKLANFPYIDKAYLVRKDVQHFSDMPVFALGIVIKQPFYLHRSPKTDHKMAQAVATAIAHPEIFYVIPLNNENTWLKKAMSAAPAAPIYQRDK
jgi:Zn-dependent protease with chaperone function